MRMYAKMAHVVILGKNQNKVSSFYMVIIFSTIQP